MVEKVHASRTGHRGLDKSKVWAVEEFSSVDLGDERRKDTLVKIAMQLAAKPSAPINQACVDSAQVKSAYRFFNNAKVECDEILDAHRLEMRKRLSGKDRIFAIQDTTFFDFNRHKATTGLGPIGSRHGRNSVQGLIMHHSLLIDADKVAYGIASQRIWAREEKNTASSRKEGRRRVQRQPIEDKESRKWLDALLDGQEWTEGLGVDLIHIGDRENDVFEFLQMAEEKNSRYVIRSCFGRQTVEGLSLDEHLDRLEVVKEFSLEVKRPNKQKRIAKISLKYTRLTLRPSKRRSGAKSELIDQYNPVEVWLVCAQEMDPPSEKERINWRLFTNVCIDNTEDALERIAWYKLRWSIEDYHKILKVGCAIEDCRLADSESLKRFIVLKSIIALKIMQLTFYSRQEPDLPCTKVLTSPQWKALYTYTQRTVRLPKTEPSLKQVTVWIAKIGGYLARRSDPPPGYLVLWRGWQTLDEITRMWLLMHPSETQ